AEGLVRAEVLVKTVQYSVVADNAVMLLMVMTVPEPAAVIEPGRSVALGKYVVQPVLLMVWVALTEPLLVANVPPMAKSIVADVAPAPTVLKASAKAWPVAAIIGVAFDAPPSS